MTCFYLEPHLLTVFGCFQIPYQSFFMQDCLYQALNIEYQEL